MATVSKNALQLERHNTKISQYLIEYALYSHTAMICILFNRFARILVLCVVMLGGDMGL